MPPFFPPTFDAFRSDWYSQHLTAMGEPSLVDVASGGGTAVRFLWLRSFHQPIAVRVQATEDAMRLVATRLSGAGGYEPGIVESRTERVLTAQEWRRLEEALAEAVFDTTPATRATLGADGAQWIVERAQDGCYRMVERWSPEPAGADAAFRSACEAFLALAGEQFVTGDVY